MDDTTLLPTAALAEPPVSAATRLRAFEDDVFGKTAPRINGAVERGVGSPFAAMTPHQAAHYAALEKLVGAEKTMADAQAALLAAQTAHDTAAKTAAAAAQASDETA